MNQKNIFIIVGIIGLIGSFYTGYFFGKSSVTKSLSGNFARMGNSTNGANTVAGRTFTQNNRNGAGFVVGEVLSKDTSSLTLKLRDGGSKIVLYTDSTTVSKMSSTSINDIVVGSQISVTGNTNSDGSVSATSIQETPNRVNN